MGHFLKTNGHLFLRLNQQPRFVGTGAMSSPLKRQLHGQYLLGPRATPSGATSPFATRLSHIVLGEQGLPVGSALGLLLCVTYGLFTNTEAVQVGPSGSPRACLQSRSAHTH